MVDATDYLQGKGSVEITHIPEQPVGVPPASAYHHVDGYLREGADGNVTYVRSHVASNPDGILENNLSYRGASIDESIDGSQAHPIHDEAVVGQEIVPEGSASDVSKRPVEVINQTAAAPVGIKPKSSNKKHKI